MAMNRPVETGRGRGNDGTAGARNILVTGVSRRAGIGFAIARALAEDGCNICFTHFAPAATPLPSWSPSPDEVPSIRRDLAVPGTQVVDIEIDLSESVGIESMVDEAERKLGPLFGLVNNAAFSVDTSIESLSAEVIDRHFAVNVRAPMLLTREFRRRFVLRKLPASGRIINLTSGYPLESNPGNLVYAASKEAMNRFVRSAAPELAPLRITINSVDPGPTDTGWMPDELREDLLRTAPMGRLGAPVDAARLVRFLMSDDAQWITGQIINSRGGF